MKELYGISQHAIASVLYKIWCVGSPRHGLYDAFPPDIMHELEEGLIQYIINEFYCQLTPRAMSFLRIFVMTVLTKNQDRVEGLVFRLQGSSILSQRMPW